MASHESSRKKRKVAYSDGRPSLSAEPPVVASSSAMPPPLTTTTMNNNKPANAPCHHETALKALNTDLDAMRQLITCKICDRLLYEPYALSCGHTYCYSCLSQWLTTNAKMTCPDCRLIIRQQPTPSYLIRELVLVFISRNELLPDGETAEEHDKMVKEEGEIVAKDKANTDARTGGLFKGRFNRSRLQLVGPLHDPGDGVERCPECHWELEDSHCVHCGFEVDDLDADFSMGDSDSNLSDEDIDHDLAEMDGEDVVVGADGADDYAWAFGAPPRAPPQFRNIVMNRPQQRVNNGPRPPPIDLDGSSDESEEEDEYDQNDTFIDDDAIRGSDESEAESDLTAGRDPSLAPHRRNGHRPVVISDDEDEESGDDEGEEVEEVRHRAPAGRGRLVHRRTAPIAISDDDNEGGTETAPSTTQGADESESDSDDEGPVVRGSQRSKRPNVAVRSRRAMTVSSEDESEESSHDGRSEATAQGGFSPIDRGFGDGMSEQTDYDDDDDPYSAETDDGEGGLGAPTFNPYEIDDASNGGYDDESDDGWGTTTTTTSTHTSNAGVEPSSRLGTLQQRRPRHISPVNRAARNHSPTPILHSTRTLPQRISDYRAAAANTNARQNPIGFGDFSRRSFLQAQSRYQRNPQHPFQLDNVLHRINNNPRDTNTNTNATTGRSNYNQRNQQARTPNQQRGVPAASNSNYRRGATTTQPNGSTNTGSRTMRGPSDDAQRRSALSVESDDTSDYSDDSQDSHVGGRSYWR